MIKTEQVEIQCPQCGHNEFECLDNMDDNDFIKCNNCHFEIMLSDLKEVGFEQAKEVVIPEIKAEADRIFKSLFKNLK